MADTKITKAMVLEAVKANVENMVFEGEVSASDVISYVDTTLEQMAKKAEKNKERAAEKRAEGDALREVVKSVLTNEPQTRDEIFAQIDGEDLSVQKIGARLTQLVATGEAVKTEVKVDKDGKSTKKMAYSLA